MPALEPPLLTPPAANPWITARRNLLKSHNIDLPDLKHGQLGIAFSGGGIRSATISLGIAQALAKADRLLDFDYMSTVSGGGYFGSFLRSLFLPQSARGSDATIDPTGCHPDDTDLALEVLKSEPASTTIAAGKMTNPIRWLRENSRYLAPAGPTDYAVAATYLVRNWLAMLFVFALPTLSFFLVLHGLVQGMAYLSLPVADGDWKILADKPPISILMVLPLLLLAFSMVVGVANWLTIYSADPTAKAAKSPPAVRIRRNADAVFGGGLVLLLVVGIMLAANQLRARAGLHAQAWHALPGGDGSATSLLMVAAAVLAIGAMAAALVGIQETSRTAREEAARIARQEPPIGNALFGNEVRRALTAFNAQVNIWLVVLLVLALVDTVALYLENAGRARGGVLAGLTVLAPLGRWLIQKLEASFGNKTQSGSIGSFVARYMWQVAFVAATLLWGGFAVLLDVLVRTVTYAPSDWLQGWLLGFLILAVLLKVIGKSVGFINLSSLHSLYAARLTRTFLGASNQDRLKNREMLNITGYQAADVILANVYQQQCCAAPLHLMNVTLNETISPTGSQLLERDRKGIPMVIAPEGIWIDAAVDPPAGVTKSDQATCSWDDFDARDAEPLSVGQITAISGAAASSAMGSRTTLGGALLFTYANIRLGYWWNRGSIAIAGSTAPTGDGLQWTGTFGYLLREMTARYRSTTGRVNLSDGGHFEDSGVYELLRRKVQTIVYCDNGEDAGYLFDDLENLVRKARLDIGVSLEVATPGEILAKLGIGAAGIFLNGKVGDWRARARSRDHTDPAFALLLLVRNAACEQVGTIVLLKPSLFGALPADVWGYAEQHVTFPHESTADQFFTEAQWESYRKLGYMMMQQLLDISPQADLFRNL